MSFTRFFEKFKFLDEIIARGSTGNQKDLARRLGISVSTLNEYLSEMKQANFPIEYSRKKQTYYYSRKGRMVNSLFNEDLDKEQMKKIIGGADYSFSFGLPKQPLTFY